MFLSLAACMSFGEIKEAVSEKIGAKPAEPQSGMPVKDPDKSSGKAVAGKPKDFAGAWVVEIKCRKRPGINSQIEYGLLEIAKNFKADFFVFEERRGSYGLPLNLGRGSILTMRGRVQDGGILLSGGEWLLKSNRTQPLNLQGQLTDDGLRMRGQVLNDSACTEFSAAKFPVNNASNRKPVFSFKSAKPGIFDKVLKRNNTDRILEQCLRVFEWFGNGRLETVVPKQGIMPALQIHSAFLDEPEFVRHFGKTFRNWTQADAQAYTHFMVPCERQQYQWSSQNPAFKKAYQKYRRIKTLFLEIGKDQPNDYASLKNPRASRSVFSALKSAPPNLRWAGNYFTLAAVQSARHYEQYLLQRLQQLDASVQSIQTLKNYLRLNEFPLRFLTEDDEARFKLAVTGLYQTRENNNAEQAFAGFDFKKYPQTLSGLKALSAGLQPLQQQVDGLSDTQKRAELNRRIQTMLQPYSAAAAAEIIAGVPVVQPTPEGYVALGRYTARVKNEDLAYLQTTEQRKVQSALNTGFDRWFTDFNRNINTWLSAQVPVNQAGLEKLNNLSRLLFNRGLSGLRTQGSSLSGAKRQVADNILAAMDKRLDDCDQLAAHPADPNNARYIQGVPDDKLNPDKAIDVCIASIENAPSNPKLNFQLGRALFAGQVYGEAFSFLTEAANQNYGPAKHYIAQYYAQGLGDTAQNMQTAERWYEEAAQSGFRPSIDFMRDYRRKLRALQEEEERFKITQYAFPEFVDSVLAGKFDQITHGAGIGYFVGVLDAINETCVNPGTGRKPISAQDITALKQAMQADTAPGYQQARLHYMFKGDLGTLFSDFTDNMSVRFDDRNYADRRNYDIFKDAMFFLQNNGCSGETFDRFIRNAKRFVLEDKLPFSLSSRRFWNLCLNKTGNIPVSKTAFCACFLHKLPIRALDRGSVKRLYNNFWPTAQQLIKNDPKKNMNLCMRPVAR